MKNKLPLLPVACAMMILADITPPRVAPKPDPESDPESAPKSDPGRGSGWSCGNHSRASIAASLPDPAGTADRREW